jgi:hypothetical protein
MKGIVKMNYFNKYCINRSYVIYIKYIYNAYILMSNNNNVQYERPQYINHRRVNNVTRCHVTQREAGSLLIHEVPRDPARGWLTSHPSPCQSSVKENQGRMSWGTGISGPLENHHDSHISQNRSLLQGQTGIKETGKERKAKL